jgi:hypothetical protein
MWQVHFSGDLPLAESGDESPRSPSTRRLEAAGEAEELVLRPWLQLAVLPDRTPSEFEQV